MTIPKESIQELEQLYNDYKNQYAGLKEDYFGLLYISNKFGKKIQDIRNNVAFGGNDYGIDGYYFDRQTKNFYLYQFKWSENHNLFKSSLERIANNGLEMLFQPSYQDSSKNDILLYAKSELDEYRNIIEKVYVDFVFKGDAEKADASYGLDSRREDIENKKYLLQEYFNNKDIQFIVQFIGDRKKPALPVKKETFEFECSESITAIDPDTNAKMICCFIPVLELHKMYKGLGHSFFSRNIRAGLSPDNPPNRKIRAALKEIVINERTNPEVFTFHHNGITIAAQSLKNSDNSILISSPRLLNGAQTICSLDKFIEANNDNPTFKENQEKLKNLKVIAKIIEYNVNSEYVTKITIANNQQNPVEPWNLRANDKIQCDLQDKFSEELAIYYSRQENSFESLSGEQLEELGIEHQRDIKIKQLAQTFLGLNGEVDNFSRLRDVFESDKIYKRIFNEKCLDYDSKTIVLGVKALLLLNPVVRDMVELIAEKYKPALKASRNLIYALLIQGILNDSDLDKNKQRYGQGLTKEIDYKEYLKRIGTRKLLKIIRTMFKSNDYAKRIENENYTFLRTKEAYNRAMSIACDLYGWNKIRKC